MTKYTFNCCSIDEEITRHEGEQCEIVRQLGPDEVDDEVGAMFEVRFKDGSTLHAFGDELTPTPSL